MKAAPDNEAAQVRRLWREHVQALFAVAIEHIEIPDRLCPDSFDSLDFPHGFLHWAGEDIGRFMEEDPRQSGGDILSPEDRAVLQLMRWSFEESKNPGRVRAALRDAIDAAIGGQEGLDSEAGS